MLFHFPEISVTHNRDLNIIKCGGIEIIGLHNVRAPKIQQTGCDAKLERQEFVPLDPRPLNHYDLKTGLTISMQIVVQNIAGLIKRPKIFEIKSNAEKELISTIKEILNNEPMIDADYYSVNLHQINNRYDVIVIDDLVSTQLNGTLLNSFLAEDGFILYIGDNDALNKHKFETIFQCFSNDQSIQLLRPIQKKIPDKYEIVEIYDQDLGWLEKVKYLSENGTNQIVYLVSQEGDSTGLIGLMRCLITESHNVNFKCIVIDRNAEEFSPDKPLYHQQMSKNLTFNIIKEGIWGTMIHFPIELSVEREVTDASISLTTIGDLSSLTWIERPPFHFK